ncbi:MAG TPA: TldD/PmbA family protein [Myxococcales bacterium]|nr:TldD/PmbA family protein [Myxococcales bacterium]
MRPLPMPAGGARGERIETVNLLDACEHLVKLARKAGASEAEAYAERTRDASVRVRDGEVEELQQASSKGIGLRVITGQRLGFSYGTDLSKEGLKKIAETAVALAKGAAKDEANGLPRGRELGAAEPGEYDPAIEEISPEWKLQAAREAEKAARGADPRVRKFDSTGAGDFLSHSAIFSSHGARGEARASYAYVYCSPVAEADGQLQTASWSDTRRKLATLQRPEEVGRIAAQRAARMLGARKAKTQRVPVVFDPQMAASFIAGLSAAVNGLLVHKKSSFLGAQLGKRIASEGVTVVDDATLPHGIGTRPFDGEGVVSRRTAVIEDGVLTSFLYDATTARKADAASTSSASRAWSSLPSIGTSNLYLERGALKPEDIVKGVKNGLYVTAMLGRGADVVTGDYSRGANGIWIENGELTYPVQEVTVSGNLLEMLRGIDAVGDDLDFRASTVAPTIRFSELVVSGA